MRIVFRDLVGDLMLDLSLPGRLFARPGFRDDVQPDRLAQVFKERVRVAFREYAGKEFTGVRFSLGVQSPYPVGLLHVEKLVSDALTAEKVIEDDRIGHVLGFDIFRYIEGVKDRHWLSLTPEGQTTIRREFATPATEWRTPTPLMDGTLRGVFETPAGYHHALSQKWESVSSSPEFKCEVPDVGFLAGLGHNDWLTRRFNLAIGITTSRADIDLDNVALYALDMATLAMREHGIDAPLDRVVGRISVRTQPGWDAISVQLRHDWTRRPIVEEP